MTGLYGAELGVFATHQRRQKGLQAPSATDGQDTVPVSVEAALPAQRHRAVVHTGAKSLPRAFATPKSDRLLETQLQPERHPPRERCSTGRWRSSAPRLDCST